MKKFLLMMMAMFIATGIYAQDEKPIKIITNHPDFKVKVKRCVASDKTVIVDLILNNEGTNDVEKVDFGSSWTGAYHEAYDDEGNIYKDDKIRICVANTNEWKENRTDEFNIPAGVPIKVSIKIEGVPTSAEAIARLSLCFNCAAWGLAYNKKPIKISNIPISRD